MNNNSYEKDKASKHSGCFFFKFIRKQNNILLRANDYEYIKII